MTDKQLEEIENVRKLLMLLLFKMGASQDEIASALNVTQARVSQMLPSKDIKPAQIQSIGPG
jgi:predicted transcriptional regulator